MSKKKVIIIGGGFGGLNTAKGLKKANCDILLIDRTNHHLFQPLLYEVASAALSPGDIAIPIREILRHQGNARVIMGNVTAIDKEQKQVQLSNGERYGYDYLVIATGANHAYFGNDIWETYAPGLKTIADALKIRERVLISFEKAERVEHVEEGSKYLNFVLIGGGPTGVEMAGAIAEIAYKTMFKNFRKINPAQAKIYLIEAMPFILPMYSQKMSLRAKHDLEKMGVKVLTNTKVLNVNENGVQIEGEFIESKNIVWCAGNQASPLLKTLALSLDRQGRAIVESDLSIPDHPEVFVIGDAASVLGKDGRPLPATASPAIQEGHYIAHILKHEIPKDKRKPFSYFDKGSMATIGKCKAVARVGKMEFAGFFAWLAWCFIHIAYLIGFRNRAGVLLEWLFRYFTYQRGARLIYGSLDKNVENENNK